VDKVIENWVPMGSGEWTYRVIDFTVPTGDWSQLTGQIIGMALWFQVWTGYNGDAIIEEMGSAWFSDTGLYIYRDGAWL
jgi:hypothetical protein